MVKRCGISIIGAGRLGRSLGGTLRERGWRIHSVVTQSPTTARRAVRSIGGGRARATLSSDVFLAPIILIAVPDSAIQAVVRRLASVGEPGARKRFILHTSGALTSEVLAPLRHLGASVGSVHPLQSFSGYGAPNLEGRVFAIEGDAGAVRVSRSLVRTLGGLTLRLDSAAKPLYHAAACMAAGQMLAEMEAAIQLFASIGLKRREAVRALLPLARQVLENQERLGARAAWTGPLGRGDFRIIAAHEEALRSRPEEYLAAYRAMNRLAARVLARDPESVLAALGQISQKSVHSLKTKGVSA